MNGIFHMSQMAIYERRVFFYMRILLLLEGVFQGRMKKKRCREMEMIDDILRHTLGWMEYDDLRVERVYGQLDELISFSVF
jgi:hypothetical protein